MGPVVRYSELRTFKMMPPKAIKEIRKFAQKAVGTRDERFDVKLNKHIWSRGIQSVPRRVRVRIAGNRNGEDANEELFRDRGRKKKEREKVGRKREGGDVRRRAAVVQEVMGEDVVATIRSHQKP
ncbi:60s ribosomal protein [Musa troglodytarum]|uniref:60s ribosomal protein n=1 Tax=Musa troglodytarum TaxID=320322 RepID=A0A9E7FHK7_9LILI|nr:60s ribosomal protein [Musa troglodytarum]